MAWASLLKLHVLVSLSCANVGTAVAAKEIGDVLLECLPDHVLELGSLVRGRMAGQ